jgi:hypothetical protein
MPADFPEAYVLLGCVECEYHYHTSWRPIWRWMRQYGADELVQLRRGYLRKLAASRGEATALGGKLRKRGGDFAELPAGHPALEWMPVRRSRRPWRKDVWVHMRDGRPIPDLDEEREHEPRPQPASLVRWRAGHAARLEIDLRTTVDAIT